MTKQRTQQHARTAKARHRQRALASRRALTPDQVAGASRAVGARLDLLATTATCIHAYIGGRDNEIDTRPFIQACLNRGQRIFAPRIREGTRTLQHAELHALDDLAPGPFGLLQPPANAAAPLPPLDLVVVPGAAFDRRGQRIGYGQGYYDRFLAGTTAYKVGLTYEDLLLDLVPTESHDVAVDAVLTEMAAHFIHPLTRENRT